MGSPRLRPGEFGEPWFIDRHEGLTPEQARRDPRARWQARVRYRDTAGRAKEVSATGDTKGAARRALERRIDERRQDLDASGGLTASSSIAMLAKSWLAERKAQGDLSANSWAVYSSEVREVIEPVFGTMRLADAKPGRIHPLLRKVERRRSTRQTRTVLRQMFAYAISMHAMATNPMHDVPREPRRRRDRKRPRALSEDDVRALRHAVRDRRKKPTTRALLPDLVEVLLASGMRIGEALALRWRDIHVEGDTTYVVVSGTLIEPRREGATRLHRQEFPKGKEDADEPGREVVLTAAAARTLRERRKSVPFRRLDDPVFANRAGGWLWPGNVRSQLRRAVERHSDLLRVHPHLFRATVATKVSERLGIEVAQEMLGHSDPAITRRYYVAPKRKRVDARGALEAPPRGASVS